MKRFFRIVLALFFLEAGILLALRLSGFLSGLFPEGILPNAVLWMVVMDYGVYLPGLLITVLAARKTGVLLPIAAYAGFAVLRQFVTFFRFLKLFPGASVPVFLLIHLGCAAAIIIQGISMTRISHSLLAAEPESAPQIS